jgi:hypothetical protein
VFQRYTKLFAVVAFIFWRFIADSDDIAGVDVEIAVDSVDSVGFDVEITVESVGFDVKIAVAVDSVGFDAAFAVDEDDTNVVDSVRIEILSDVN